MNTPEFKSPHDIRNRHRALGWGMLLIGCCIGVSHFIAAWSDALPADKKEIIDCYLNAVPVVEVPPPTTGTPIDSTVTYTPPLTLIKTAAKEESPPVTTEVAAGKMIQASHPDASTGLKIYVEVPPVAEDSSYNLITFEKLPVFPGGERELLKFLAENIRYPPLALENDIQGTVVLRFVVNEDGQMTNMVLIRDIGGGCGQEALRIMNSMPCWKPGEINGHPVKMRFDLPVRFRVE